MTIDEFMRDIGIKMRPGWVAMDEDKVWYWFSSEPKAEYRAWFGKELCHICLGCFDIDPVDDWTQSLRETGSDD